jgi:hypothetical protein
MEFHALAMLGDSVNIAALEVHYSGGGTQVDF